MATRYRALLRIPGVGALFAFNFVARLPDGMLNLAILLAVARSTSLATGGVAAGVYAVANAVGGPVRGRCVDQFGPARVIAVSAAMQITALVGLAAVVSQDSAPATLVLSALVGVTGPPLVATARGVWTRALPVDQLRATAFALESALGELIYIAGTVLAGTIGGAAAAPVSLLVAAGLRLVGCAGLLSSPLLRLWTPGGLTGRPRWGALASGQLRALLAVQLFTFAAFGAVDVAVTSFAGHHDATGYIGLVLGCYGLSSAIGGVVQGSRDWRSPLARQQSAWLFAAAALLVPVAFAPTMLVLALLMLLAGFPIAPASTLAFSLTAVFAPAGTDAEAYTWLTAATYVGLAAGTSSAGLLHRSGAAFALAIAASTVGALISLAPALHRQPLARCDRR